MNAALLQIKTSYESLNMTPEQIAEDQGLDVVAVKSGLMQFSSKYRKDCGHEDKAVDELNFSDEQLMRVNQVIFDMAIGGEDEHLRFKAACYVRDDKKGRKEVVKAQASNTFNILAINDSLKAAKEATLRMKDRFSQQRAIEA